MFKDKKICNFEVHLVDNGNSPSISIKATNEESLLTALAIFVNQLKENAKINEYKIKYAVNLGMKNRKDVETNLKVQEIHISKENEEEFKKFLNKLMKGE